jgi:cell division protein FtsB
MPWLLNMVTLALIGVLAFWGRSLADDVKSDRVSVAEQANQLSGLIASRQADHDRLERIEDKLDQILATVRR